MPIMLAEYEFDPARTAVWERVEEVAGKDARLVRIKGVIEAATSAEVQEKLDALAAASSDAELMALSLREGRRLMVQRRNFARELSQQGRVAAYTLELEAPEVFEESNLESEVEWAISATGAETEIENEGNESAPLLVEMQLNADAEKIAISDGTRNMQLGGTSVAGATVTFDGHNKSILRDGTDVTPYATGDFPVAGPGTTTLTFVGGGAGIDITATVRLRARWR